MASANWTQLRPVIYFGVTNSAFHSSLIPQYMSLFLLPTTPMSSRATELCVKPNQRCSRSASMALLGLLLISLSYKSHKKKNDKRDESYNCGNYHGTWHPYAIAALRTAKIICYCCHAKSTS
jgi:hypothetical protein